MQSLAPGFRRFSSSVSVQVSRWEANQGQRYTLLRVSSFSPPPSLPSTPPMHVQRIAVSIINKYMLHASPLPTPVIYVHVMVIVIIIIIVTSSPFHLPFPIIVIIL